MPETKLSLHRKLAQVMYEADRIPKNGTAPAAMGGFKFVQVGDAADVIRKALAEQKISMIPTAIELVDQTEHPSGADGKKVMTTMTVRTTWTLTDGDTGETAVIQSLGSGGDTGDKAAPKAQSNAMKYALLMGFLLSTGDDPEMTDTSDRRPAERNPRVGAPGYEAPRAPETPQDGSLIGTVEIGKAPSDFELRAGPTGNAISFRLKDGRSSIKVVAQDPLASALALVRGDILGQRVVCWGTVSMESFQKDGKTIEYRVLALDRIQTPEFTLPASESTDAAVSSPAAPTANPSEPDELDALPLFEETAA